MLFRSVHVALTNVAAGHCVPTDTPLRHLILLVEATGETGDVLDQVAGPVLPEWAGVGNPEDGYLAGLPGETFAKVLESTWFGTAPTAEFWNPTRVARDNRLRPFETKRLEFVFIASGVRSATVRVSLIYRRAFRWLEDIKGWGHADVVLGRHVLIVPDRWF